MRLDGIKLMDGLSVVFDNRKFSIWTYTLYNKWMVKSLIKYIKVTKSLACPDKDTCKRHHKPFWNNELGALWCDISWGNTVSPKIIRTLSFFLIIFLIQFALVAYVFLWECYIIIRQCMMIFIQSIYTIHIQCNSIKCKILDKIIIRKLL